LREKLTFFISKIALVQENIADNVYVHVYIHKYTLDIDGLINLETFSPNTHTHTHTHTNTHKRHKKHTKTNMIP